MALYYEVVRSRKLGGVRLRKGDVITDADWPGGLSRKLTEQRVVALLSVPMTEEEARQHAASLGSRFCPEPESGSVLEESVDEDLVDDDDEDDELDEELEERARALSEKTLEEWAAYSESSRRRWRKKAAEEQED